MLVPKELIPGPGLYWYTDQETGLPRKIRFTAEGLQHLCDSGRQMLAANLSIPVPLEHQPDGRPVSAADRAASKLKNNAGWVKDFQLKNGALWGILDIQDEEIARKLPRTIRWTSPWITSFMDGQGKPWHGVIGHVALTTRPRISRQAPFGSLAAAMSFATTLADLAFSPAAAGSLYPAGKGLSVSRAGLLAGEGNLLRPAYPLAFSLYSGGIALAAGELEEVVKKEKKPPGDARPPGDSRVGDVPPKPGGEPAPDQPALPGMPGQPPSLVDADGDIPVHEVIADLLETMGVALEEGATADNFLEKLYKAVMARMKEAGVHPGGDMSNTDPGNLTNQPPGGKNPNDLPPNPRMNVVQEQPPLYMSLEQSLAEARKIADPALRAVVEAALSHQQTESKKTQAIQNRLLADARAVRDRRIEALARGADAAYRDRLVALGQGASLSIGDDGAVHDSAAGVLDLLEHERGQQKRLPDLLLSRSGLQAVDHPRDSHAGEMTAERADQVVDEFCKNAGIAVPGGNRSR
jgi:hypothetical protein